jgi:hypothetical protein
MANWLIVAVAIAKAPIFIGGFYQLVSVQGPSGTYLMVSNMIMGIQRSACRRAVGSWVSYQRTLSDCWILAARHSWHPPS